MYDITRYANIAIYGELFISVITKTCVAYYSITTQISVLSLSSSFVHYIEIIRIAIAVVVIVTVKTVIFVNNIYERYTYTDTYTDIYIICQYRYNTHAICLAWVWKSEYDWSQQRDRTNRKSASLTTARGEFAERIRIAKNIPTIAIHRQMNFTMFVSVIGLTSWLIGTIKAARSAAYRRLNSITINNDAIE